MEKIDLDKIHAGDIIKIGFVNNSYLILRVIELSRYSDVLMLISGDLLSTNNILFKRSSRIRLSFYSKTEVIRYDDMDELIACII